MIKTKYVIFGIYMVSFLLASCVNEKEPAKKPNILFILADDQAYNTIGALGNEEVITPNLDKLVESGVSFTHAYNMGGWHGAVCVASRTMFNTGRTVWNAQATEKFLAKRDSVYTAQLWGNILSDAGYDTYMSGKWHVKAKLKDCFDFIGTERPGMPNQTPEGYNRPLNEKDTTWMPWHKQYDGFWKGGTHWSEVLANETIGFIDQALDRPNPFFMYVAFNAPHDPRQSPKEYVDMYPLEDISLPQSFRPLYPEKDDIGCSAGLRDEKLAPFPRTEYSVKVNLQEYYAIITHMDHQIGRIMEALEKSGQKDNTYIFYTADHGLACGAHGLMGKQNMYDHSMRAPLIVIGPDLPKDKRIDLDVYIQDIMPSTLDLAGLDKPKYVEFNSLMPLINKKQRKSSYDAIYGTYMNKQRMVRADGFKLIIYPDANKIKLFDLVNDPMEENNLANDKKYTTQVKELIEKLRNQQKQMGDELDLKALFSNI